MPTPNDTKTAAIDLGNDDSSEVHSDHLLVVMADDRFVTYPLLNDVVIGRSTSADIQVVNPSVSRRHVRIGMGPPFSVEDLGSANGTMLRGARLAPSQPMEVDEGETVTIGDIVVRIQRRTGSPLHRQLLAHGSFMQELGAQCKLADRGRHHLALVRVSSPTPKAATDVQVELARVFRLGDVLGQYAPQEFEVIVLARSRHDLKAPVTRAERAAIGAGCTLGVAFYGEDGTTADALLAQASARVRPASGEATAIAVEALEPALGPVLDLIRTVGPSDITALILGETGVGKEVAAELIHRYSKRSGAPLVKINCAAISESLLESELFGHERGAFTGADRAKPGLIEAANGGTFFLDEIAEMPARLQAKLLQVLEASTVRRVGGVQGRPVDVRFVAAANRDMHAEIAAKRFRADLFYRLNGVTIDIPPLRERRGHIEALANLFLQQAAQRAGRPSVPTLGADTLQAMQTYAWPGNVRELKNVVERAVLVSTGDQIQRQHLSFRDAPPGAREASLETLAPGDALPGHATLDTQLGAAPAVPLDDEGTPVPLDDDLAPAMAHRLAAVERAYIVEALKRTGGNQTKAARLLGMSRNWLVNKLRDHAITAADWVG